MSFNLPELPDGWTFSPLESCSRKGSISYGVVQPGVGISDGVPIIRVNNFKDTRIDLTDVMRITPEIESKYGRTRLVGGEILLTLVGSVGQVAVVPKAMAGFNVARAVAVIHPLPHIDPEWIGLCLRSPLLQHLLGSRANTTVQTTINLKDVRALPIPIPPERERHQITEMLVALDDRITLLRETNTTLEAIAQAMFKSWFVDFDPVHAKQQGRAPEGMDEATAALFPDSFEKSELGLVPKGWEIKTIWDVCDFQNGYAFKSNEMTKSTENTYKIFKMGNIKKGGGLNRVGTKDYFEIAKSKNLDRYLIKKGDLLMCMTDMKNNVALLGHTALMDVDNQFLLNQRVGMLRSRDVEIANFPFLYILTNSDFFI